MSLPLVFLPTDVKPIGPHPFYALGKKYADAVRLGANCLPLPLLVGNPSDIDAYLDQAAGIVLPGSKSNIHPRHFGQIVHNTELPLDELRDAVTLPLIEKALARGIPLLAICRGFQELNVALGGSLHQAVQEVAGRFDHRENESLSAAEQYAPVHTVRFTAGGAFEALYGSQEIKVNSLHGQGINRLASRLVVEAVAPDGQIEAVRVQDAKGFALGVQWHPEWDIQNNPLGQVLFKAFGQACRDFVAAKKTIAEG